MDDRVNRFAMNLVVNSNDARLWIFYETYGKSTVGSSVRCVAKEPGNLALSPEQIVTADFEDSSDESIMLRIVQGKAVLDLYFRKEDNEKTVIRVRSVNNGATWSREDIPSSSFCLDGDSFKGIYGAGMTAPSALFKRCAKGGKIYMEVSEDEGKNWAHRTFMDLQLLGDFYLFSGSGKLNTLRAFVYGEAVEGEGYLYEWKVAEGTFTPVKEQPVSLGITIRNTFPYRSQYYKGGHHLYLSLDDMEYHIVYVYRNLPQGFIQTSPHPIKVLVITEESHHQQIKKSSPREEVFGN